LSKCLIDKRVSPSKAILHFYPSCLLLNYLQQTA